MLSFPSIRSSDGKENNFLGSELVQMKKKMTMFHIRGVMVEEIVKSYYNNLTYFR